MDKRRGQLIMCYQCYHSAVCVNYDNSCNYAHKFDGCFKPRKDLKSGYIQNQWLDALHEDLLYKEILIKNLVEALKRAGHQEDCPVLFGASADCVPGTCPISKIPGRRFNVGDEVYITVRDKFRRIQKGVVDYWSFNEMGEGAYAYYVKVGKRYSRYVCADPGQYDRVLLSMNYIYHTEEEARMELNRRRRPNS